MAIVSAYLVPKHVLLALHLALIHIDPGDEELDALLIGVAVCLIDEMLLNVVGQEVADEGEHEVAFIKDAVLIVDLNLGHNLLHEHNRLIDIPFPDLHL